MQLRFGQLSVYRKLYIVYTVFEIIGLVDANDVDDFHIKFASLKELWDSREQEYLPIGATAKFHDYILERVSL